MPIYSKAKADPDEMFAGVLSEHKSRTGKTVPHLGSGFDLIIKFYLQSAQKKKETAPASLFTKDPTKTGNGTTRKRIASAPTPKEKSKSGSIFTTPTSTHVDDESDRTNSSNTELSSTSTAATSPPSTFPTFIPAQEPVNWAPNPRVSDFTSAGYFDVNTTFYYAGQYGGNGMAPGGVLIAPSTIIVAQGKQHSNAAHHQAKVFTPYPGVNLYHVPWSGRPHELVPMYHTTLSEKRTLLQIKAAELVSLDATLMHEQTIGPVATRPVHIFVDLSNIIIGFYDKMKAVRGIPPQRRVKAPAFDFLAFDQLLLRNRPAAKRIVAGSLSSRVQTWPAYMEEAADAGYEMNIMRRVAKTDLPRNSKDALYDQATTSSPDSSLDDAGIRAVQKEAEQGVDELLHLKMLQSVMDVRNKPATAILATGDAAQAQFSDGFKANVERMLEGGWNVELYGWSKNISSAWRDSRFLNRWGLQFRMIELDNFAEELFAYHIPDMYF